VQHFLYKVLQWDDIDYTRELKRNSGAQLGYQPAYTEQQAKSRRWRGSRLLRKPDLQPAVLKALAQGWSPAQVAGCLKKENRRHADQL
jgi:IS30 family transposase